MKNNPLVSVICNTYNQENYIAQAIEGFVMQKTNFDFEVIIHDDASTDRTAEIIREYEKRYPTIIKPIYEKENQYSNKNVKITFDISIPKAKGKYIAFCEGDDYWVDNYKLQKQFDYMESNPKCTLCIHNAIKIKNGRNVGKFEIVDISKKISTQSVIEGGGGFIATNSIFSRIELFKNAPSFIREFAYDYMYQMYLASCGETYCFNDYMSVYRVNAISSWSVTYSKNIDYKIKWIEKEIKVLEYIDNYNKKVYNSTIEKVIEERKFNILWLKKDFKPLLKEPYKKYVERLSLGNKLKFYLEKDFPSVFNFLKKLKNNIIK